MTFTGTRSQLRVMVRRILSLLLAVALFGVAGQSAVYAANQPAPMQAMHMTMSMDDCMTMMAQAGPAKSSKAGRHGGCMPGDCRNFMLACSGLAAMPVGDVMPTLPAYSQDSVLPPQIAVLLIGQTSPPDIRPPIA